MIKLSGTKIEVGGAQWEVHEAPPGVALSEKISII
jgi:hypothetical protein